MAKRYGGKHSPDGQGEVHSAPHERIERDPAGARANVLFIPAIPLVATCLNDGALALSTALIGAGVCTLAAWLLRDGLKAEAEYNARKVARRPALPRKILASALTGIGAGFAVLAHAQVLAIGEIMAAILFGLCASALHVTAFGLDPLKSKGMEGIDTYQQDRVARVVDEAENLLESMRDTISRAKDPAVEKRLEQFQSTARTLIRTVEEDPRDLTAARKYLGVYLRGARDATVKFADIYSRTQDAQARADYLALLEDLDQNFAARTKKSLLDDHSDLTVEIDVLRERLSREGVRLD